MYSIEQHKWLKRISSFPKTSVQRELVALSGEELGTMSKNNLRMITPLIRPIWEINSYHPSIFSSTPIFLLHEQQYNPSWQVWKKKHGGRPDDVRGESWCFPIELVSFVCWQSITSVEFKLVARQVEASVVIREAKLNFIAESSTRVYFSQHFASTCDTVFCCKTSWSQIQQCISSCNATMLQDKLKKNVARITRPLRNWESFCDIRLPP